MQTHLEVLQIVLILRYMHRAGNSGDQVVHRCHLGGLYLGIVIGRTARHADFAVECVFSLCVCVCVGGWNVVSCDLGMNDPVTTLDTESMSMLYTSYAQTMRKRLRNPRYYRYSL